MMAGWHIAIVPTPPQQPSSIPTTLLIVVGVLLAILAYRAWRS